MVDQLKGRSHLKEGLTTHLVGQRQSKLVMAKDFVCMLASSSQLGWQRYCLDFKC